jgi:hypothetical protein
MQYTPRSMAGMNNMSAEVAVADGYAATMVKAYHSPNPNHSPSPKPIALTLALDLTLTLTPALALTP